VNDIILRSPVRDFRIKAGGTMHNVRTNSTGKKSIHQGLDFSPAIAGVPGQQIESAIDGEIVFEGVTPGFGNQVVVETNLGNGRILYTSYNHLQSVAQRDDEKKAVNSSDPLGTMGSSGLSSFGKRVAPHFHFETIVTDGKLDFSQGWPLGKGGSGTANGVNWERISPQIQIGGMTVTSTPDSVRATLRSPWATAAPPADSSPSFNDRFSAAHSPAATPIGDGKGIGRLPDIAATYAGGGGVGAPPPVAAPNFVGPGIPFVSTPAGSLVARDGSALLDSAPMSPGTSGLFSTGGRFVPRSLPPQPLYPIGSLVPASNVHMQDRQGLLDDRFGYGSSSPVEDTDRFRSPVLRELQKYRRSAAFDVAAVPSSAAANLGIPHALSAVDNGAEGAPGGVLKWIGNDLIPSAEASPSKLLSQGNEVESPSVPDNRRYLSGRIASQASAFDTSARAVPFIASNGSLSPDRPNIFDDRFGNWPSTSGMAQQASRPLGLVTGQPMPDWPVAPPIFDLPNRSSGRDGEVPKSGTGIPLLDEYIRYLDREYAT
jgi:hypothetical protein